MQIASRTAIRLHGSRFAGGFLFGIRLTVRLLLAAVVIINDQLRAYTRLDIPITIIAAIYLFAFIPIIPRATDNPQFLACCINDEPMLTMALDGMRVMPYGDPISFLIPSINGKSLPNYWSGFNYSGSGWYYGGLYFGLAFLAYGPLEVFGLPPFPTGPIILRIISTLAGLLALLITYNFGRYHIGPIAGAIAALVLLTDSYFVHYSVIIHPDSLQFALGMLVLAVAVRHVEQGDLKSVAALGLLSGAIQGTKMGGPWIIPLVAVTLAVGLRHQYRHLSIEFLRRLTIRAMLAMLLSILAYFVTTPYAFLSLDFFWLTRTLMTNVLLGRITSISYVNWLQDLSGHFGPFILLASWAGIALVCFQALLRKLQWPMLLALVLGASQLGWYAFFGALWVELGYMLCTFAIIGLFFGKFLQDICHLVARISLVGRPIAACVGALVMLAVIGERWWETAAAALEYRLTESKSVVQIGRWAEAHIDPQARILWDDTAYFDPAKFPNGRMFGDLLKYNDLYERQPDYIVLSASMYDARHYAELLKTQHFTMQNEGPYSVRLYQDLLNTEKPGTMASPGIEYVRSFTASAGRLQDCVTGDETERSYKPWLGEAAFSQASELILSLFGGSWIGLWLVERVAPQVWLFNHAGKLVDAIVGRICITTGWTLRLYRIHPPGSPDGFSTPFASSTRKGFTALAAFDGQPSTWAPAPEEALNSAIGFDFGGGGEKPITRVRIGSAHAELAATKVEVLNTPTTGRTGKSGGVFEVDIDRSHNGVSSDHELLNQVGAHRLWRVGVPRGPSQPQASH